MDLAVALFLGVLAHMIGDYIIQTDWMAQEKTSRWLPAVVHAVSYGLPFLVITTDPIALAIIVGTHAVIDRYRLARHVCWAKNQLAPKAYRHPWEECKATGYHEGRPPWLAVWLMIIADNTIHIAINSAAIWYAVAL
jgi:hypothetical protein